MRAITPFRSADTVNFQGEITGKSEEAGKRVLECRIKGINQRGELVCLSDASLEMGKQGSSMEQVLQKIIPSDLKILGDVVQDDAEGSDF